MKIEIEIRDNIAPDIALDCVRSVITDGKISKGEKEKMYYCWATIFTIVPKDDTNKYQLTVATQQYRKNDCFVVYKENQIKE